MIENDQQGRFSAANFAKFRKIPQHYYPQIPYGLRPVGFVVLTDNTSKGFIVTCNTKTHYIRPLMMKIRVIIIIIKVKT